MPTCLMDNHKNLFPTYLMENVCTLYMQRVCFICLMATYLQQNFIFDLILMLLLFWPKPITSSPNIDIPPPTLCAYSN